MNTETTAPKLTTSAMIASFADPGQYTDMHIFREAHPDRFFQIGMAEQAAAEGDRLVVTLENHTIVGGLAESVAATLAFAGKGRRIAPIGLPDEFLAAGALPHAA